MGKGLITAGVVITIVGVVLHYAPGAATWFGKLPGDFRYEGERTAFYIPLASSLLLSLVLSLVFTIFFRR